MSTALVGFTSETQVLVDIACRLGQAKKKGDREEFESTLAALGMEPEEAQMYWDEISGWNGGSDPGQTWLEVRCNTHLAGKFGILLNGNRFPRNWLLYRLLACHFPDILSAEVIGTRHIGGQAGRGNPDRRRIVFNKLPLQPSGKHMTVCKVYQGQQPAQFTDSFLQAAAPLCSALGDETGMRLAEFLVNQKMLIPSANMAELVGRIMQAGWEGQPVTIVGAFCPDYAYEETGNPQLPYRYTFDGVGEGVGLVAQQFARIIPGMAKFLEESGIEYRIVLGIGDFEADSKTVLERVKLDRPEFIRRCQKSLDAFQEKVSHVPMTLELFGEARGEGRLHRYAQEATERMMQGGFGCMPALYGHGLEDFIARIPHQYGTFYRRWYGEGMGDDEVRNIVLSQGGEYASVARIYAEDFGPNTIILAGDRPEMHWFNAFFQLQPTLCAKRAY